MTSVALPAGATRNPLRTLAWAGIVVGLVAAFVALPPDLVALVGPEPAARAPRRAGGDLRASRAGERRFGMYAVATALLAFALAYLATRSSIGKLDTVVVWSALFAAMLRYATPLIFAALGGMFSERSGVVNIGLEGMMLTGAFFGILAADKLDSWVLGLLVAILSGGADGAAARGLVDPLPRRPDHLRLRGQLPRARPDRLPVHRHLRAGGDAERHPEHPQRPPRVPRRRRRSSGTSSGTST